MVDAASTALTFHLYKSLKQPDRSIIEIIIKIKFDFETKLN